MLLHSFNINHKIHFYIVIIIIIMKIYCFGHENL